MYIIQKGIESQVVFEIILMCKLTTHFKNHYELLEELSNDEELELLELSNDEELEDEL